MALTITPKRPPFCLSLRRQHSPLDDTPPQVEVPQWTPKVKPHMSSGDIKVSEDKEIDIEAAIRPEATSGLSRSGRLDVSLAVNGPGAGNRRRLLSQTQVLLTKIKKLCSEIRAIKEENKSNKYSSKLPESKNKPKPQNNHSSAVPDTYDEHALHARKPYDSTPNPQTHLSYTHDTPQGHEAPLTQTLSLRMPDLLNPSHASSSDCKDACEDPSELTESGSRGGIVGPLSAMKNGRETGVGQTD